MFAPTARHRAVSRPRESLSPSLKKRLRRRFGYADAGFTLAETIVSMTIFVIVATAGTLAVITGINTNNNSNDRVAAAQIAQQELDRARAVPRASLGVPTQTSTATRGNKSYSVTRSLIYSPAGATACPAPSSVPTDTAVHKITVTVRVTIPGRQTRTVRMDSVLAC